MLMPKGFRVYGSGLRVLRGVGFKGRDLGVLGVKASSAKNIAIHSLPKLLLSASQKQVR